MAKIKGTNELFLNSCDAGNLNKVRSIFKNIKAKPVDPKNLALGFTWACRKGHTGIVKEIISFIDNSSDMNRKNEFHRQYNYGFHCACEHGHLEIVRFLLTSKDIGQNADIRSEEGTGLRRACRNGHLEIAEYLLTSQELTSHADIHAHDDAAFKMACMKGQLGVVKYLTKSPSLKEHANIHAENDCGLTWACHRGHMDIIEFLINETDHYHIAGIKNLELEDFSKISKKEVIEMIKARDLKNQLYNEVSLKNTTAKKIAYSI